MKTKTTLKAAFLSAAVVLSVFAPPARKAFSKLSDSNKQLEAEKLDVPLEEASITELQEALQSWKVSSVQLVKYYLQRIEAFDRNGPKINSVRTINQNALHIAVEKDKEREKGMTGPLHGIPILLKDNIETIDNMPTTAGSLALEENFAVEDSFIAAKLREAGAIILGKTNMSEWAYFLTEGAPSGYSSAGGQVLHPYGPAAFEHGSVGGSSSGSGAAVASNFAAGAVGTETSGSILSPASANSIVGIKPTLGLLSRTGIVPLAGSQDTPGPMARTVADAAVMLGVMAGMDQEDPVTAAGEGRALEDYTSHLQKDGLDGARIGLDVNFLSEKDTEEREIIENAVEEMQQKGAVIVEITIPNSEFTSNVLWYELKRDLNAYLSRVPEEVPVSSLEEVIAFNKEDPNVRMRFGQAHFERALGMSTDPNEPEYLEHRAKDVRLSTVEGINKVMQEHQLDALLFENNRGAAMPAKAGYPSITVPAGYTKQNMPVGVTFSAMAFSEPKLIELAYSYEQSAQKRKAPVFQM